MVGIRSKSINSALTLLPAGTVIRHSQRPLIKFRAGYPGDVISPDSSSKDAPQDSRVTLYYKKIKEQFKMRTFVKISFFTCKLYPLNSVFGLKVLNLTKISLVSLVKGALFEFPQYVPISSNISEDPSVSFDPGATEYITT